MDKFNCIKENNFEEFKKLIKTNLDYSLNTDGYNLLHYSIICNKNEFVKYLIEEGMDYNRLSRNNWDALQIATIYDNFKALDILKKNGANFKKKYNNPTSLLYLSSTLEAIEYFLKNGFNEKDVYNNIEEFIKNSVAGNEFELFKYLIENYEVDYKNIIVYDNKNILECIQEYYKIFENKNKFDNYMVGYIFALFNRIDSINKDVINQITNATKDLSNISENRLIKIEKFLNYVESIWNK